MPKSLTTTENNILRPEDFDPPLKRKKPSVPYYWSVDELATEIGMTDRKVQYDIKGQPEKNIPPKLKAYKVGPVFLVPETDALEYIWHYRQRKKKR